MSGAARLGLLALLALLPARCALGAAPVERTILSGGVERRYLLVVPDGLSSGLRPLVLLLHGHSGSARQALGLARLGRGALSRWVDLAARDGVLVAALDGLRGPDHQQGWNDCRSDAENNPAGDDVAFLDAVAARLVKEDRADPSRVYVMGMSNGAMMAFRAALEMDPPPAAIAAVSGLMAGRSQCKLARARVSVLLIEGTGDPMVPYGGGAVGLLRRWSPEGRGLVLSARDTVAYWLKADGLSGAPRRKDIPHRDPQDPTSAVREDWGAPAGPEVSLITVNGGGHVEPSPTRRMGWLYRKLLGAQNGDFESAEAAWDFFKTKRVLRARGADLP